MDPEVTNWKLIVYGVFFCACVWMVVAWGPAQLLPLYAQQSQAAPALAPVSTAQQAYADADALLSTLAVATSSTQGSTTITYISATSTYNRHQHEPYPGDLFSGSGTHAT